MKKRFLSVLLAVIMIVSALPMTAAAATYNANAAVSYARNNCTTSKELCAGFVSKCVSAGGVSVYKAGVGDLYRALPGLGFKQYTMKPSGQMYKLSDNPNAKIGDVIIYWCSACSKNEYKHAVIITEINSSGTIKITGTNAVFNNIDVGATYSAGCGHGRANEGKLIAYLMHWTGTSTPPDVVSVKSTTTCKYTITIPANYKLQCYQTETSTANYKSINAQSASYYISATKKIVLSNGVIRYFFKSGDGYNLYFDYTSKMSVKQVHNFTSSYYEAAHPHRDYKICTCKATEYTGTTRKISTCKTCYPPTYTVSLNANGGSCSTTKLTIKENGTYGTLPTPTRTGYAFNGWYTAASGGTKVASSSKVSNSNHTLYAQWVANTYAVKYNANGGSGSMANSSHTYDVAKALTANSFTREGYNFIGWATSANGGVAHNDKANVKNLSAKKGETVNLYAVWEVEEIILQNVVYHANGGYFSNNETSVTIKVGERYILPTDPVRDGFTFVGWFTDAVNGTMVTNETKVKDISAFNLYAHWQENSSGEPLPEPDDAIFTDISSHWGRPSIEWVYERGLFGGTGNRKFSPNGKMNRAMLATVLYRLEGEPTVIEPSSFSDVPSGMWFSDAIKWASDAGIVTGVGNNRFNPNGNVTREQLAVMLHRYAGTPQGNGTIETFEDNAYVSPFAIDAMKWAVGSDVVTGKGGNKLDPKGDASRAEVATMIKRFAE